MSVERYLFIYPICIIVKLHTPLHTYMYIVICLWGIVLGLSARIYEQQAC